MRSGCTDLHVATQPGACNPRRGATHLLCRCRHTWSRSSASVAIVKTVQRQLMVLLGARALCLLGVVLVSLAATPLVAGDTVIDLSDTATATTLALSSLPVGSLAITELAGGDPGNCGVTATVQPADTVNSIMCAEYPSTCNARARHACCVRLNIAFSKTHTRRVMQQRAAERVSRVWSRLRTCQPSTPHWTSRSL